MRPIERTSSSSCCKKTSKFTSSIWTSSSESWSKDASRSMAMPARRELD